MAFLPPPTGAPARSPRARPTQAQWRRPTATTRPPSATRVAPPATAGRAAAPTAAEDPRLALFPGATYLHRSPDILYIPHLLPPDALAGLIDSHRATVASTPAPEAPLYLNAAVNADVAAAGASAVTAALTAAEGVDGAALPATARAGLRVAVPAAAVRALAPAWLPAIGAAPGTEVVFDDSLVWKPSRERVVVRDATTVHYRAGEGVGPHVDGKDVTVLVYLTDVPGGGSTVFPRVGVSVAPEAGSALVYCSRVGLLHYAAAVTEGDKWVLQLLVDTVPDVGVGEGGMVVDYATGQVTYT